MKKRNVIVVGVLVMVLLSVGAAVSIFQKEKESELLEKLYAYQGYTRVVTKEEYEFYSYFVERDLQNDINEDEVKQKIVDYTKRVNAVFFLGNKLGLCEKYSFEALKLRMEQENLDRKIKQENGEVIYGLEQFSLETFYQYTLDNLETKIQQYLETNADQGIYNLAKEYYKKNNADTDGFKNNREFVLYQYVRYELFDLIIEQIAENNPIEFESN